VIREEWQARVQFLVLVSTGALVVWLLAGPESNDRIWRCGALLLGAFTLSGLMVTGHQSTREVRGGLWALVLLAVGASAGVWAASDGLGAILVAIVLLLIGLAGPWLVIRGVLARRKLDVRTMWSAITFYLLIGLAASMGMAILSEIETVPTLALNGSPVDTSLREQVYWAFVTLSTTGYGDYVPRTGAARALAIATFTLGQLYLVVALASIVSLLTSRIAAERMPES
jgi:hypothetical protein